jgi:hypothetical protein
MVRGVPIVRETASRLDALGRVLILYTEPVGAENKAIGGNPAHFWPAPTDQLCGGGNP